MDLKPAPLAARWRVETLPRNEAAILLPSGERMVSGTFALMCARRIVASVNRFLSVPLEVLKNSTVKLCDLEPDAWIQEAPSHPMYWRLVQQPNGSAAIVDGIGEQVASGNAAIEDAERVVASVNRLLHLNGMVLWQEDQEMSAKLVRPLELTELMGDRASVLLPNGERFEAPISVARRIVRSFNLLINEDHDAIQSAERATLV